MDIAVNGSLAADELSFPGTGVDVVANPHHHIEPERGHQHDQSDRHRLTAARTSASRRRTTGPRTRRRHRRQATCAPQRERRHPITLAMGRVHGQRQRDRIRAVSGRAATSTTHRRRPHAGHLLTFTVQARDAAGNLSGASNSVTVRRPHQAPGTRRRDINGLLRVVCAVTRHSKPISCAA